MDLNRIRELAGIKKLNESLFDHLHDDQAAELMDSASLAWDSLSGSENDQFRVMFDDIVEGLLGSKSEGMSSLKKLTDMLRNRNTPEIKSFLEKATRAVNSIPSNGVNEEYNVHENLIDASLDLTDSAHDVLAKLHNQDQRYLFNNAFADFLECLDEKSESGAKASLKNLQDMFANYNTKSVKTFLQNAVDAVNSIHLKDQRNFPEKSEKVKLALLNLSKELSGKIKNMNDVQINKLVSDLQNFCKTHQI